MRICSSHTSRSKPFPSHQLLNESPRTAEMFYTTEVHVSPPMHECVWPTKEPRYLKTDSDRRRFESVPGSQPHTLTCETESQGAALRMPSFSSERITLNSTHPSPFSSISLLIYSQLLSLHSPCLFAPIEHCICLCFMGKSAVYSGIFTARQSNAT